MAVKKKETRKLIDVPETALKILSKLATNDRMPVKTYMEKILIGHADINKGILTDGNKSK